MSLAIEHKIGACARRAGVHAAWHQWAQLGANVLNATDAAESIIDPEALLLSSLYLEPTERRLRDVVYWWAGVGSDLLSVQRTKTLMKRYPSGTRERLGHFARWAVEAGDKRWRRYAAEEPEGSRTLTARGGKGVDHPRLKVPPALVLRLRAGFGVNAKADVLAYLLGRQEQSASTQEVADATAFSRPTVGGALRDLEWAGFIQETGRQSARYVAPVRQWSALLQFHTAPNPHGSASRSGRAGVPTWQPWADVFACLADTVEWAQETNEVSDYLLSSQARDIYERYRHVFESSELDVPHPEDYRGAAYLDAFATTVERLASWMDRHL